MKPRFHGPLAKPLRVLIASLGLCAFAHADWWNAEWSSRTPVSFDAASASAGQPVLVRLHAGNFDFAAAREDGSDLRFVAADGKTVLPHHIERFDAMLGEAFIWVKAPARPADAKPGAPSIVRLYYGNAGAPAASSDGVEAATATLVWHFAERAGAARDSSPAGNHAASAHIAAEGALVGSGARFDGASALPLPASATLAQAADAEYALSLWAKPAREQERAVLFSRRDGADALVLGLERGEPFVEITRAGKPTRSAKVAAVAPGKWAHLAVSAKAGETLLYVNGEPAAKLPVGLPALKTSGVLGADSGAKPAGFAGEVDELRVASAALTPEGARFAAINQGPDGAATASPGAAETAASAGAGGEDHAGYFKVIVDSLTFDGWVVIGLLAVMAAASWVLMITKVGYLNAGARGNRAFMRGWSKLSRNLHAIDNGDHSKVETLGGMITAEEARAVAASPLYRIFDVGAEEIRHRMRAEGSAHHLTAESIEAIRARLDGAMVRETQKLDRLMVILTISISGGPFLGLLGTVVGVMITFAAVAMAGDVNVNAIAPGISAALLATVAGLGVAIPALFGYNYILGRIKDIKADIQVFIDEFITSMAEFYQPDSGASEAGHSTEAELLRALARLDASLKGQQAALDKLCARLDRPAALHPQVMQLVEDGE